MQIYINELDNGVNDLNSNYEFIENIAQGAFGTVIHVKDTINNKDLAVKVINKTGRKVNLIHKMKEEVTILKQLNHENIVKYYGYEETNSKLYIIMEYIKYGTLNEFMNKNIGKIKEEDASIIISKLLSATEYLHNKLICHRDIKPENIMFSKENDLSSIKLIDFGLSEQNLYNPLFEGYAGTLLYMSPEQIEKKSYSQTVDIWSIGIILFMLLNNNKHPFYIKGDDKKSYIEKIKKRKFKFECNISFMAKNLIMKLLEINPSWRYSSEKAIRHPWITRKKNDEIPKTFNEILSFRNSIKNIKDISLISIFLNFCKKNENFFNINNNNIINDNNISNENINNDINDVNNDIVNNSINDNNDDLNEEKENENIEFFKIDDNYINKCNYYSLKKKEKLKKEKEFGLEIIDIDNISRRNSIKRRSVKVNSIIRKNDNENILLKSFKKQKSKKEEKEVKFKLFTDKKQLNKQNRKYNIEKLNKSLQFQNKKITFYNQTKSISNGNKKSKINKNLFFQTEKDELKSRNKRIFLKNDNMKTLSPISSKKKIRKISKCSSILNEENFPFVKNCLSKNLIYKKIFTEINNDKISPLVLPQIPISNRVINIFQIGNF